MGFLYKSVGHVILDSTFESIFEFSQFIQAFLLKVGKKKKKEVGGWKESEIFTGSYSALCVFTANFINLFSQKSVLGRHT